MSRIFRSRFIFCTLFCAGLAGFIDFTDYHSSINADTIVVYLVSLLKWTPFFWGQDRYGMVLPWLAQPLHDPLANLLMQNFMHMTLAFGSFFLSARYLFPGPRWPLIGLLGVLLFLALNGWRELSGFLTPWQIYSTAFAFAWLALILAERSVVAAALLMILACWANFSVVVFFSGLIVLKHTFVEDSLCKVHFRSMVRELGVLAVGVVGGLLIRAPYAARLRQVYAPSVTDKLSAVYSINWNFTALFGWARIVKNFWDSEFSNVSILLGPSLLLLGALIWARTYAKTMVVRRDLRMALIGVVWSWIYLVGVGVSQMALWSEYPARYLTPSVLLWVICQSGPLVTILSSSISVALKPVAPALISLLIVVTVVLRFGFPSLEAVQEALQTALEPIAEEPIRLRCTHVVGDYYRVWPSVFYARMTTDLPLWGVASRAMEMQELFSLKKFNEPRLCLWKDNLAEAKATMSFKNLNVIEESDKMLVLAPAH